MTEAPPTTDEVYQAQQHAIACWRRMRRADLRDEDKVLGALIRYQMFLDALPGRRALEEGQG